MAQAVNGSNQIYTTINVIKVTIRFFIEDGTIRALVKSFVRSRYKGGVSLMSIDNLKRFHKDKKYDIVVQPFIASEEKPIIGVSDWKNNQEGKTEEYLIEHEKNLLYI